DRNPYNLCNHIYSLRRRKWMPTKIRGTLLNCRPAFIHDYHRSPWKSPREPAPAVARLQFRWRWRNCAEDDFLNAKKLAKRKRHLMNQARIAEPKEPVVSANRSSRRCDLPSSQPVLPEWRNLPSVQLAKLQKAPEPVLSLAPSA